MTETASDSARPWGDLPAILSHRRWWFSDWPFPHFRATDVFASGFYSQLEHSVHELLARGLAEKPDPRRLTPMDSYDAFGWSVPTGVAGPLALFHDQEWHDLLARLTGVAATGDVNCSVHHHRGGGEHGRIHCDLGIGWFPGALPTGTVNPSDPAVCSYRHGVVHTPGAPVHEAVRAVTMIFYLANPPWRGGGQTGLYRAAGAPIASPAVSVPPVNNSILVFENTPRALHAFIGNTRSARNSVILWLHRPLEQARLMFGADSLFRWPPPRQSVRPSP